MDLEGDETSLGICWAVAASFLEWEGCRWGGAGWDPSLLPSRDQTENLLHGEGKARSSAELLTLWDVKKPAPGEPKPSGVMWC